jgi:hypothetical protein
MLKSFFMKNRKNLFFLILFAALFICMPGWNRVGISQSAMPGLFAASHGPEALGTARVTVRYAKVLSLPDVKSRIIKEVGYGTMLLVWGQSGEYFQISALNQAATVEAEPWYVLRSEVEMVPSNFPQPLVDNRRVTFTPAETMAGQPILFTASNFRTPKLLKWDMGDGSILASGGKVDPGQDATLAYAFSTPGRYTVKVFDDNGSSSSLPVTTQVTVVAYSRAFKVSPEQPLKPEARVGDDPRRIRMEPAHAVAGATLQFNAVNFNTPDRLRWDMGNGIVLPGENETRVLVGSLVNYSYPKPGDYEIKVFDWNGDARRPPVRLAVVIHPAAPVAATKTLEAPPPAQSVGAIFIAKVAPGRKKHPLLKFGPYAGYFGPQHDWFKKIYGEGDVIYGARLGVHLWKGFYFWLSASQFQVIAKTTFTEDKTTLTLLPFSAFLRYSIRLAFIHPYMGIGYTYMNFKEESAIGNTSGNGNNRTVEAGFELKMNRHFIVDFNARYDMIKVKPTGFEIDLGGLQTGIALLVSF